MDGLTFAYFGVNPSTADATIDDATVDHFKVAAAIRDTAYYGGSALNCDIVQHARTRDDVHVAGRNGHIGDGAHRPAGKTAGQRPELR